MDGLGGEDTVFACVACIECGCCRFAGSEPSEDAYNNLRELYQQEGLSDEEIDDLLVLDVKDDSYFSDQGVTNQHGQGGGLFVEDDVVMGWLLGK